MNDGSVESESAEKSTIDYREFQGAYLAGFKQAQRIEELVFSIIVGDAEGSLISAEINSEPCQHGRTARNNIQQT